MPRPDCPSQDELSAFSLGELSEAALEEVAGHLERCRSCESRVQSLDHVSDPVIDSLRSLPGGEPPPATSPIPAHVGEYEILGELGRGGMGVVYKARHEQLRRVVALKMLLGGGFAQERYRARFRTEAEAVARLQHPNIVQIFDVGEWNGTDSGPPVAYFTLEYVDGGSLNARLDGEPQPPVRAAELLLPLASAVHYAHGQGVVHRDLKPSNVLLTADGQPKLCDFGVAKMLTGSANETLGGLLVGTPEYMAPEQASGQAGDVGTAADVYALGAILYTTLTGRPPFRSASVLETLEQVRSQEPVSPRRLQPSVSRDLETICLKCLHKDPRRRYPSAAALADDLERFLSRQPILARPAGVLERAWKRARRRPREAVLSVALAGLGVLGFALVFGQWQRAETKAAAEVAANQNAQTARRLAVERQAEIALVQGLSLCDQGEVPHGLLWLSRTLQLFAAAGSMGADRAIRINLADWEAQLSRNRSSLRHSSPVLDLAFSPDGGTLVTAGKDRFVRTWDTATGKETGPPLVAGDSAEGCWVNRVAFNPADGNCLVTADDRGHLVFWDLTGRQRSGLPPALPPGQGVRGFAFSPDGRRLLTWSGDGEARWTDVATRRPVGAPLRLDGFMGDPPMALSPDGRTLATGGGDRRAVRWDLVTGRRIGLALPHKAPVSAIAYCRDGRGIITGTRRGRLHLWDPEASRSCELTPQGNSVTSLAVSPDGGVFATGTADGVVRLWDTDTYGQPGQSLMLVRPVTSLAFHPDGTVLATAQDDGTVRIWDLPRPKAIGRPLRLNHPVQSVSFSPDGTRLRAAGDRESRSWALCPDRPCDAATTTAVGGALPGLGCDQAHETPDTDDVSTVSADGRTLATATRTTVGGQVRGLVELRDATSGERLRQTPEQPDALVGLAFSPDSSRLLTWSSGTGSACLWDVATLRGPRPLFRSLEVPIRRVVFSPDGKALLIGCPDGTARLWDVASDEEVNPGLRPHHGYPVTSVAFDPSGTKVVTGCQDGSLGLWDLASGKPLFDLHGKSGEVVAVTFSADGETLLTASHDGTARFWDAGSGQRLGPALRHSDAVLCVAFHPDGQSVATGTQDGKVQLWRVPPRPDQGGVDQIRRRIETQTGLWLDYQGAVHTLNLGNGRTRGR